MYSGRRRLVWDILGVHVRKEDSKMKHLRRNAECKLGFRYIFRPVGELSDSQTRVIFYESTPSSLLKGDK